MNHMETSHGEKINPDKKKCAGVIVNQKEIEQGIFSMWLEFPEDYNIAEKSVPGQFVSLYCQEGSKLLPRPISICEVNKEKRQLRIVYRVAGYGTKEFSLKKQGDTIDVIGPLGNGFTLEEGSSILIGGGIGIPPMLELAKSLSGNVSIVLGYRDENLFLKEEFEPYGKVYISTEDGSVGTKGNVIDAIVENNIQGDKIYSCGPTPMLRGVKSYAMEKGIKAEISLEEKMACGIGACLGCVCQSKEKDDHSQVNNKRICKDGPVFNAQDIEL